MHAAREGRSSPARYWLKLALFLACAVTALGALEVAKQALSTVNQLDRIEADRDAWQRPAEVIAGLNLRHGDSVLDLGCGSGYFSLKLSDTVGPTGKVFADDIRRLSLAFIWIRTISESKHNITVVHGRIDGPHLRAGTMNAVLISNTYHEFTAPRTIMNDVRQSLVPGGRVVIVDRWHQEALQPATGSQDHGISPEQVEADLGQTGFTTDSRRDDFIRSDPSGATWWMIVAHRS